MILHPHRRNTGLKYGCDRAYAIPIPSVSELQLYVNFGSTISAITIVMNSLCTDETKVISATKFVTGQSPAGYWYGIFRGFEASANDYALFEIELSLSDGRKYYSDLISINHRCEELTKISTCYPSNFNAEDINGVYVGVPSFSVDGDSSIFYQHKYWVKDAIVFEIGNTITYKNNWRRTFGASITKNYELRTEAVPGWYKDYLLSVYCRGDFKINEIRARATDIACTLIDEGLDLWKPYAKLGKEHHAAFGCANIDCEKEKTESCVAISDFILADTQGGIYSEEYTPTYN